MIGDGGKIGGPPGVPSPVTPQSPGSGEAAKPSAGKSAPAVQDSFTKSESRPRVDSGPKGSGPAPTGRESAASADLLRIARENPAAARQLAATLASQSTATLTEVERELAAARALLEKLAQERFAKDARRKASEELNRRRDKIAKLKLRHSMAMRKMALLQQVAGKLGDPRLDQEIDRILNHHGKLKSDWGRRHHLLSLGESLCAEVEETPEHLRRVIAADVRAGSRGEEVANEMRNVSPRAVIAELVARSIDGSVREKRIESAAGRRGEYGRTMQSFSLLSDLLDDALARDPFTGKE